MKKPELNTQLAGKLLLGNRSQTRFALSLLALWSGSLLLLIAVALWWNFNTLINSNSAQNTSTFLVISKRITNENMGRAGSTVFGEGEIAQITKAPQVTDLGLISSNHFPAYAVVGGQTPFATELPLESMPDRFLDTLPADWQWQAGNRVVPVVLSTQFLDIYNYVFAPSQGMPQLSQSSVKSIGITLKIGNENYIAHVTAFSDRINSVLVPQSFMDYGNSKFPVAGSIAGPSRLILKVNDPNNKAFGKYLQEHNYYTADQNLRWNRIRALVEVVVASTGLLAFIILGISTLVLTLFMELTITKAKDSVQTLLLLGYSPGMLSRLMVSKFVPRIVLAMLSAAVLIIVLQFALSRSAIDYGLQLNVMPGIPVWIAFGINFGSVVLAMVAAIRKTLKKI